MDKGQLHFLLKSMLVCVFCALIFPQAFANSAHQDNQLNKKRAGVLYNLSKFIDWPTQAFPNEKTAFNICLLGKVVFLDALKTFEKRQIRGRTVRIHVLKNLATRRPIKISDCQTLYINSSAKRSLPKILAILNKKSILTISDLPDFVLQGGMIGLLQVEKRVRFTINLDAAKSVNLVISAPLLRLAKSIKYKDSQINNPE